MGFYRGGPVFMSALSGIDIALWDLKGEVHLFNAVIGMHVLIPVCSKKARSPYIRASRGQGP